MTQAFYIGYMHKTAGPVPVIPRGAAGFSVAQQPFGPTHPTLNKPSTWRTPTKPVGNIPAKAVPKQIPEIRAGQVKANQKLLKPPAGYPKASGMSPTPKPNPFAGIPLTVLK